MSDSTSQLTLELAPVAPHSLQYFVQHSGVAEAFTTLAARVEEVAEKSQQFRIVYVFGQRGCGKTHLLTAYRQEAYRLGIAPDRVCMLDLSDWSSSDDDERVAAIVAEYDHLKAEGGLMLLEAESPPKDVSSNPHLQSRLLAGDVLRLSYPREEELRPLLQSLAERRNLKLSENSIDYLLKRLPLEPLSFDNIFAKISEFSLSRSKPAGLGVVREVWKDTAGES